MRNYRHERHDAIRAIISAWRAASPTERAVGREWYPTASALVGIIADHTSTDPRTVAAVLAALSPRNPWRWNVADAATFCDAARRGLPQPTATTFGHNRNTAWRILRLETGWKSAAPKARAFARACSGDRRSVVVDVWAVRVATDGRRDSVSGQRDYDNLARAYTVAARIVGETPRELQAIVWHAAQHSDPRSRHARTLKANTPEYLKGAL